MNVTQDELEFNVLGYNVRLKADEEGGQELAAEVVDMVRQEADKIKTNAPALDKGQIAILVALKMAKQSLQTNQEYRTNVDKLQSKAKDALKLIEEVSPATV